METTFAILATSLKSPRPYEEGIPEVVAVDENRDCLAGGTAVERLCMPYASIPVLRSGACREGGKLFIHA
jgi:hypothetical protein